jgi:PKD repeat protein
MKKSIFFLTFIYLFICFNACKTDPPTADFEANKTKAYIGEDISFANKTTGADSYLWDFGDNFTSTEINPVHSYLNGGPKTIVLTATNKSGTDNCIYKVNVYNGKSSYQVKNSTSISLVLSSFYWDGNEVQDFVMHGTMTTAAVSDTIYTSRNKISLGGTMLGVTFIVTSDFQINEHRHNILIINDSSPVYTKSAEIKSENILLKKLDYLINK